MEIGKTLKEAREARGLTLEAVEEETKIRRKYLQALEEEQYEILPGPIYAKAFLKNYAKFLKINVEEAIEAYNRRFSEETVPEASETKSEEPVRVEVPGKPRYWLYLAAAVVIVGLAFSIFYAAGGAWLSRPLEQAKEGANKGTPPAAQTPLPKAPAGQQAAPGQQPTASPAGVNLVLNVKHNTSWMRVLVDGTPAFEGELSAGQSQAFEAKNKILIRLGNAGAVEVLVNGQSQGFLGGDGEVVEREFSAQPGA